jgi:glycerol-3-phosphate responsive antiterminator
MSTKEHRMISKEE